MSAPELVAAQQAVDRGHAHAGEHEDRVELAGLDRLHGVPERHVLRAHFLGGDPEVMQDRVGD